MLSPATWQTVYKDLNAPLNIDNMVSLPHAYDVLNPFAVTQIQINPKNIKTFVSKNKTTIEEVGILGISIGASILTAGAATTVLAPLDVGLLTPLVTASAEGAVGFATFNGVNTALSTYAATGHLPTANQELGSIELGAAIGAIAGPIFEGGMDIAKIKYAEWTGKPIETIMSVPQYVAKYGENEQIPGFLGTINKLGMESDNAYVSIMDKDTGIIGTRYYNAVNMGHGSSGRIMEYLNDIVKSTGDNGLKIGSASAIDTLKTLTEGVTIHGVESADFLGGVRAFADPEEEGMYFNLPSLNNEPIFLNYGPKLARPIAGIDSASKFAWNLNPFKAEGSFLEVDIDINDVSSTTLKEFRDETGLNPYTPEGKRALSTFIAEKAAAEGKPVFIPYQNYFSGTDELQLLGKVGRQLEFPETEKVLFLNPKEGVIPYLIPKATFALRATGSFTDLEGDAVTAATQGILNPDTESAMSASNSIRYYNPLKNIIPDIASSFSRESYFSSGSSLVDPIISSGYSQIGGFVSASPSKTSFQPSISASSLFSSVSGSPLSIDSITSSGSSKFSNSVFSSGLISRASRSPSKNSSYSSVKSKSSSSGSFSLSSSFPYESPYSHHRLLPPSIMPFWGGSPPKAKSKSSKKKTRLHYMPSVTAIEFNIFGKETKGIGNSLIRPMPY